MQKYTGLEIAVVGMSGRFPGADDINSFWENLKNGVESVSFFSDEELLQEGESPEDLSNPAYVKANAYLKNKEYFDAAFFNYRPDEARLMDPQLRLFHECVWEALEDAGCNPDATQDKIGVYAGSSTNSSWVVYSELMNTNGRVDDFTASQLNNARYVASRVSYCLNLKGPSLLLDTACSSSLVAIQQACKSLLLGDCHIAVAGGVSVNNKAVKGYWYAEGMIHSQDGHCRTFDADASGTVGGEGAAVVVLKTLKNALKQGDHIWGIIKGGGTNNDGNSKMSFTAPSIDGQTESILTAHNWSKVEPKSISYIETHGTATVLGDPIEIEALNRAFGKSSEKYCALGSVKSNVGHLDSAAGAAGFIKTVLALKHRQLPPSLHFQAPNPKIDFDQTPFYVNTALKPWVNEQYPLRAGVSSFGVGGTNAHLIVEEAPEQEPVSAGRPHQLLLVSAKTAPALDRNVARLQAFLQQQPAGSLADVAYTLQVGRKPFAYRAMLVCENNTAAGQAPDWKLSRLPVEERAAPAVAFLFPGQGAQYAGMYQGLYETEPFFRAELDQCFAIIRDKTGQDLKPIVFATEASSLFASINETMYTQPALFCVEYALARLLMHWGIQPSIMIGHSIGEYVAACLSGVFTLEDALLLVVSRGQLVQRTAGGSMLSISITEEALRPLLAAYQPLSLAAVNSSELCVVGGDTALVQALQRDLEEKGYTTRLLRTSHAFHSYMLDGIVEEFARIVASVPIGKPTIPFISNITGEEVSAEQVQQPSYWVQHLRHTVQFSKSLERLLQKEHVLLVEVGPGRALSTFAKAQRTRTKHHHVVTLGQGAKETGDDLQRLLQGVGECWLQGVVPNWTAMYEGEIRRKVSLPTYAFEKVKYPVIVDVRKLLKGLMEGGSSSALLTAEQDQWQNDSALPTLVVEAGTTATAAAHCATTEQLLRLWQQFFGLSAIGLDDDFFDIGGDSLKAVTMIARIKKEFHVALPITEFFKMATVQKVSAYILAQSAAPAQEAPLAIHSAGKRAFYKASSAQQRLFFLHELDTTSLAYNTPQVYRLTGKVDFEKLNAAFNSLVAAHKVLRTTFHIIEGELVQKVAPTATLDIAYQQATAEQLPQVISSFVAPFELQQLPLTRLALVQVQPEEHLLLIDAHHIVSDGISQGLFLQALAEAYAGEPVAVPALQYADYAEWQQNEQQTTIQKQKEFWLHTFAGELPVLELPLDFARPPVKSHEGATFAFDISVEETAALRGIAAAEGATLYMLLLSLHTILLSKLCNQTDIVVGTPASGRQYAELENMLGMFVNTLPLRHRVEATASFPAFLQDVKANALACFDNQAYQYEDLVEALDVKRDTSRNPLFDVLFSYQSMEASELHTAGLTFAPVPAPQQVAQFDLTLWAMETNGRLYFRLEYATALFKPETIETFADYYKNLIDNVIARPVQTVGALSILSVAAQNQLLHDFNPTASAYPADRTLVSLFEETALRCAAQTAVVYNNVPLTYHQLNEQSNQLARRLRALGMGTGSVVGILLHRSHDLLVSLLGILKAGCTYLPIDPAYPAERIRYVVANSGLELVVTEPSLLEVCAQVGHHIQAVNLAERAAWQEDGTNLAIPLKPADLAYLIYTSGSTGQPKGVMISHRNVVNFAHGVQQAIAFAPNSRILCLTTVSFDIFVLETIVPLLSGMQVVLAGAEDQRSDTALAALISNNQVDMVQMTPSHLQLLLAAGQGARALQSVGTLMIGGEAFPAGLLKELQGFYGGKIYNMYGPTETTVWSTVEDLTSQSAITIGKPISNTVIRILNENRELQPIGIAGELYIGGDGVAAGYWNNQELTLERFIADPFAENAQLYRTGDLAKWLPDGRIEYLGRVDNQVKIRGFRIELGEIESRMMEMAGIREAVAAVKILNEDSYIVGYYMADELVEASRMQEHLADTLPYYMVPAAYVKLASLPLTPNGKLNRKALPDPHMVRSSATFKAASNPVEEALVEIWAEVLRLDEALISVNASFFDLGGHSLKATIVLNKINKFFGVQVPLREVFNKQNIENLADYITTISIYQRQLKPDEQTIEITL